MKSSHGCGTVHKQLIRELKKNLSGLLPSNAKRPLLVDVRRSKTSLLKFPINPLSPKSDQDQISPFNINAL